MFFGSVEKPPRLSEFELNVPERLIAKEPLKKRDKCNLMVLNRKEQTIEHRCCYQYRPRYKCVRFIPFLQHQIL